MTPEEKVKRYNEALEMAKIAHKDEDRHLKATLERIFPELKENEDERIRKKLIDLIYKVYANTSYITCDEHERMLAWLEKQEGCECIKKDWLEHIKQSWYKEGFIDGKYTPKEWTINDATTLNGLIDFLENGTAKLQHDLTLYANWLKTQFSPIEKQGEQNLVNFEEAEKEKSDFVSGKFIQCRKSFNEFKEDNSYWLEYIGDDTYIGRSDNILNQKFHITPRQLYRLFSQEHCIKNNNEETNAPFGYGKKYSTLEHYTNN